MGSCPLLIIVFKYCISASVTEVACVTLILPQVFTDRRFYLIRKYRVCTWKIDPLGGVDQCVDQDNAEWRGPDLRTAGARKK
jgi:hypothetical protein